MTPRPGIREAPTETRDVEQYYVSDADQTYVVTFSFSPTVADADRDAVTGPVLASWTFTG